MNQQRQRGAFRRMPNTLHTLISATIESEHRGLETLHQVPPSPEQRLLSQVVIDLVMTDDDAEVATGAGAGAWLGY